MTEAKDTTDISGTAKVVIIGGGAMGCGLLYALAHEGWTDTVLIEKAELTSGSTWHAAGLCPSFIGSYNMAKIHHASNTLYPKLEEETEQYVSWHGCGGIRLAYTETEVDWFRHVAGFAPNIGFEMEIIGPNEIKRHIPHLNVEGLVAGARTTMDGHVDPAGVSNAMAAGARKLGATIHRHTLVTGTKQRPSGEWEVVTDRGTIVCEHVVNAAGCYADEVAKWAGLRAPIVNMAHQYFVTEPIQEFLDTDEEMPVVRDPYSSCYYRQEQKSGLIGVYETAPEHAEICWDHRGGWPEWDSENELFDGDFDKSMTHLERALERVPIWAESGMRRVVHGAIPHTPDANPMLGPAPGVQNYWMCNGSAIGIAQGGGSGKYLAQWMVHGQSEINMAELDPRRFGDWFDEDYIRVKGSEDYNRMYACTPPGLELEAGREMRTTPLYEKLKAKGAIYTAVHGWERPKVFSPGTGEIPGFRRSNLHDIVAEECRAVRERAGIMDLSSFAKFDITGKDAEAFLNRFCANRMPKKDGGIVLAHVLNENGVFESEATITRLGEGRFYFLSSANSEMRDTHLLQNNKADGEDVTIENVTDDWGILVVAGPNSRDVLAGLTEADLTNDGFRWLTGQEIDIAGVPLRALRVNYVGELGWELHAPMDRLADLYDAIWAAGEAHGIADFGAYAVNSLRLEKAYKGYGAEMTNEITMIEADMERFIKWEKDDFTGKAALANRKQQGIETQCVYVEVDADDTDVRGGEAALADGRCIGVTTSGGYGHASGKSLAFVYVEPAFAAPGSKFEIPILGQPRTATVLADPVWDPANERLRA